jgi:predicted glycoside hydrolase/deacetylase ChbG (UPF0249 family)
MAARCQPTCKRRLVVNADDFGASSSVNQAVVRAHREGILTTASLMVNELTFEEAVALARENPRLGVGLHLMLASCPIAAGFRFFFKRSLLPQLKAEIRSQLEKFIASGLTLDHVNSHHHLHMHPMVIGILLECLRELKITRVRLTWEPVWINVRNVAGRRFRNVSHALIYAVLSRPVRRAFRRDHIHHPRFVFGLMQNHAVDETYLNQLLPALPEGDSELYSHPSLDNFRHEFEALISPHVRELVQRLGIRLIRYQDL